MTGRTSAKTTFTSVRRPVRGRRIAKRLAVFVVVALAATTVFGWFTADPSVGHWKSVEGRQAYVTAYEKTMAGVRKPTRTLDVPTRYGTVRVYHWVSDDPGAKDRLPVVLFPGVTSGAPMWSEQMSEIVRHRDTFAMDAIADAGLSAQTTPLRSYEEQAEWVEDMLAGLELKKVHSVGHSFGAATAAIHAQQHPERVADLTLLEPAFVLSYPPVSTFFWTTITALPVPASWKDRAFAEIGGVSVDEVRADTAMGRMITAGNEHYSPGWPTPVPRDDARLRAYRMPVYVAIASDKSLAGGEKAAEKARLIPNATVETWPNTTHSLPMQAGKALTDTLHGWWGGVEGGPMQSG